MNLDNLQTFIQVVHSGSISGAARHLKISQSAVSQKIKALEQDLGFDLLIRHTQGIELSPVGEVLYQKSLILLEQTRDLKKSLLRFHEIEQGCLRISLPPPILRQLFIPLFHNLKEKHPDCQIQLRALPPRRALTALVQQQIDWICLATDQWQKLKTSSFRHTEFETTLLPAVPYTFVSHFRHPLWYFHRQLKKSNRTLLPIHLQKYSLVILDEGTQLRSFINAQDHELQTHVSVDIEMYDLEGVKTFLQPPFLYLGLIPQQDLSFFHNHPWIREVTISSLSLQRSFILVSLPSRRSSYLFKIFKDSLEEILGALHPIGSRSETRQIPSKTNADDEQGDRPSHPTEG